MKTILLISTLAVLISCQGGLNKTEQKIFDTVVHITETYSEHTFCLDVPNISYTVQLPFLYSYQRLIKSMHNIIANLDGATMSEGWKVNKHDDNMRFTTLTYKNMQLSLHYHKELKSLYISPLLRSNNNNK